MKNVSGMFVSSDRLENAKTEKMMHIFYRFNKSK